MADMTFETQLIAACLQNEEIYKRAKRAQIDEQFFEGNDFNKYVFRHAAYLHGIGNPFTESAFETLIRQDEVLDPREKAAFISRISLMFKEPTDDVELALDQLVKRKRDKDVFGLVQASAHMLSKKADPNEIVDYMRRAVSRLTDVTHDFEVQDFWQSYTQRRQKREQIVDNPHDRFHFVNELAIFQPYFYYGIPPATMFQISGHTGTGKSTLLGNIARHAIHPSNGLDTIYIAAENTLEQIGNRLDALVLDRDYDKLFDEEFTKGPEADQDFVFYRSAVRKGWGNLLLVKVPTRKFDANTIRAILEDAIDAKLKPRVLIVDSPDHQQPIEKAKEHWAKKGNVFYDLKEVAEEFDQCTFLSWPLTGTSAKKDFIDNEDVAGSQDSARVIDFQIMIHKDKQDQLLRRARMKVTKNREYGVLDQQYIELYFKHSNLLIPFNEATADIPIRRVQKDEEE